jgi:hypothetical protein
MSPCLNHDHYLIEHAFRLGAWRTWTISGHPRGFGASRVLIPRNGARSDCSLGDEESAPEYQKGCSEGILPDSYFLYPWCVYSPITLLAEAGSHDFFDIASWRLSGVLITGMIVPCE